MNRKSVGNIVLFVLLSVVLLGGWWLVETYFFPKQPPPETKPEEKKGPTEQPAAFAQVRAAEPLLALSGGAVVGKPGEIVRWKPKVEPVKPVEPSGPPRLLALNGDGYNLRVLLNDKGGGVQQVVLPAFDQASREGRRAKDAAGQEYPLELVPGYYRDVKHTTVLEDGPHLKLTEGEVGKLPPEVALAPASYTLLHYDLPGQRPSNELATRKWVVVKMKDGKPADDGVEVVVRTDETGGEREREVVFETTLAEPYFVRIRKTFTLAKGDYHVRMRLEFNTTEGRAANNPPKLRYQISGPRNVPIEGEWYSGTLRNAVVGYKGKGGEARRVLQDATHITTEHGSIAYAPKSNEAPGDLSFAAVVNQFFAAAVCIDPDQPNKDVWEYVRATREWQDNPFERGLDAHYTDKPQLGDITVRAVSRELPLTAGQSESHSYWLYHGPTKVRLLNTLHLFGDDHKRYEPDPALVYHQYSKGIGLTAITDSASPNWFGGFLQAVMWTDLVVWFTNIMHDILGWMHEVVPAWMVNILMLTVLVRLVLMLPSRRQQAGMLKMQEKMTAMKPELDKLQEKYKNDPQRLNQEKTRLMIQHGVNPLTSMGGCLLMFAQMPIFLGLYYCLQESIFFRLHGTTIWWMPNLAAPDMLIPWTEHIPFLSAADQVGHSWYLGPFFNILPVVAVALMYLNFKISSPPPTDDQQAMQQRTMKFMMLFMGVFFYKMAAGLCLYFICSTLWGMTERWLLKRKRKKMEEAAAAGVVDGPSLNGTPAKPTDPPKPPGFFTRVKSGLLEKLEEAQKQAEAQRQIVNNPQQKPPNPPPPPGNPGQGRQGKKKRKK